jgi:lipopolysaccharide transport system permease protein
MTAIESEKTNSSATPSWHIRIQRSSGWSALNVFELWKYRDLFRILAMRDVKLRYKQTALGVSWVILQPLLTSGIFAVIFGMLADLPSGDTPYLLFAFAGTLPWTLFAQSLQRAGSSLVGSREMISKVYFPRMILPASSSMAVLVDFMVGLATIVILFAVYKVTLTWNLFAIPVLVLVNLLLSVGVSLWVSAFSVYYRDFIYALPFLIQAWMYASPVAYDTSIVPEQWYSLYSLNPMVGVIEGFRWSLLGGTEFPLLPLGISLGMSLVIFFSGAFIFRRIERSFADVI